MCLKLLSIALVLGLAVSGVALAEEIIHFTNGTTMAVRSHTVEDGMIHVDLGSNALIAFPDSMVEKIEEAGRDVYLSPSFQRANVTASRIGGGGNVKTAARASDGSYPVTGVGSRPSAYRSRRKARGSDIWGTGRSQRGASMSGGASGAAGRIKADARMPGGSASPGNDVIGDKHAIATSSMAGRSKRASLTRVGLLPGKGGTETKPPASGDDQQAPAGGSSSSTGGN